jgi:Tannase and feruloyl esterase
MTRTVALALFVLGFSRPLAVDTMAAGGSCESLAVTALSNGTVTSATSIPAGGFVPPGGAGRGNAAQQYATLPAFCRVQATLKPSSDSDIKVEVWMPASGWNGKLQSVGNGGWAGTISYPALATAVAKGYASASTDTGHSTPGASFATDHPEKLIDYSYRAVHEMTVQAKVLLGAFYGSGPKLSMWNGCSTGGRQGVIEASRYPADYDAIIAGAIPVTSPRLHAARVHLAQVVHRSTASFIPAEKYPAIHEAALAACDLDDGVKDGVIGDPRRCKFDPKMIECKGADNASCLTPEQVETAKALYSPLKDPRTGATLSFQLYHPGSELVWATLAGPEPFQIAVEAFKDIVFKNPNWDWHAFNPSADYELVETRLSGFNPPSANLKPFFDHGGKLLMYHGWADQQVAPLNTVSYYDAVMNAVGRNAAGKSIALYMIPGMGHCQGGAGTDTFDKVAAIEQWVGSGRAPSQIVATHQTAGKADRARPLCQYPQIAKYKGTGNVDDAASFACVNPQ